MSSSGRNREGLAVNGRQPTYGAAHVEEAVDRRVGEGVGAGGMAAQVRAAHEGHCQAAQRASSTAPSWRP